MTFLWAWIAVCAYAGMGYLVYWAFKPRPKPQEGADWFWGPTSVGWERVTPSVPNDQQGSEPKS